MIWTDSNDAEIQECLDRLVAEQKKHQEILTPLGVIITNLKSIQSRVSISHIKNKKSTKILPQDKWGANIKDTERHKLKKECIDKTNELLGATNA